MIVGLPRGSAEEDGGRAHTGGGRGHEAGGGAGGGRGGVEEGSWGGGGLEEGVMGRRGGCKNGVGVLKAEAGPFISFGVGSCISPWSPLFLKRGLDRSPPASFRAPTIRTGPVGPLGGGYSMDNARCGHREAGPAGRAVRRGQGKGEGGEEGVRGPTSMTLRCPTPAIMKWRNITF